MTNNENGKWSHWLTALVLVLFSAASGQQPGSLEIQIANRKMLVDYRLPDEDANGLSDAWEERYFDRVGVNRDEDADGDGRTNYQEFRDHTDPTKSDTDGDGLDDGHEAGLGTDPNDSNSNTLPSLTWVCRTTRGTFIPQQILRYTGLRGFSADSATYYSRMTWTLTRSGTPENDGTFTVFAEYEDGTAGWTGVKDFSWVPLDISLASFRGHWDWIEEGSHHYDNFLNTTWYDVGTWANGLRSSYSLKASNPRYNGTLSDSRVEWTETHAFGDNETYTDTFVVKLSGVAAPIIEPAHTEVSVSDWGAGGPTGYFHTGEGYQFTQYFLVVPPEMKGLTFAWYEVFMPADAGPRVRTLRSWKITDTKSPQFTLGSNGGPDGEYSVELFSPTCQMGVDGDRDGALDLVADSDATTEVRPFRFWLNDDVDQEHAVDGSDSEQDDLLASSDGKVDWQRNVITCPRGLEDFARIQLSVSGLTDSIKNGSLYLGVKWKNTTGTPAVKLYRATDTDGSTAYLTDASAGNRQALEVAIIDARYPGYAPDGQFASDHTLIEGTDVFVIPSQQFVNLSESNPRTNFLFEGCKTGTGQLTLVILKKENDGSFTTIGEGGGVWFDLKPIDQFYERWTVGDTSGGAPLATPTRVKVGLSSSGDATGYTAGFSYAANAPEEMKYILYVHGWNMAPWEKNRFAETAFKRLFWQNYKGQFGIFCWPTTYSFEPPASAVRDSTNYDRGEWAAWRSAVPLKNLLVDLKGTYGNQVYVMAHSMGNVVTGEALRLASQQGTGVLVNTYVASQAAVPAHCYDGSLTENIAAIFQGLSIQRHVDGTKLPNVYPDWLRGNGSAACRRVNFYNENDYALWHDVWELNQYLKPDWPDAPDQPWYYGYEDNLGAPPDVHSSFIRFDHFNTDGDPVGVQEMQLGTQAAVGDRYEIMAFGSESRTRAVGATTGSLTMNDSLNLQSIWPADDQSVKLHNGLDYSAHKWHSAQFRSTNMRQHGYWEALLGRTGFNLATP